MKLYYASWFATEFNQRLIYPIWENTNRFNISFSHFESANLSRFFLYDSSPDL